MCSIIFLSCVGMCVEKHLVFIRRGFICFQITTIIKSKVCIVINWVFMSSHRHIITIMQNCSFCSAWIWRKAELAYCWVYSLEHAPQVSTLFYKLPQLYHLSTKHWLIIILYGFLSSISKSESWAIICCAFVLIQWCTFYVVYLS